MSKKLTIQDMQQLAKKYYGACLSSEYKDNDTKLTWKCSNGHVWGAVYRYVRSGHWCSKCTGRGNRRLTIEEMKELAKSRGGKCLSGEYINNTTNLKWQCKEGHIWEASPLGVKRGNWCKKCSGLDRLTIEEMVQIATERGGKCISSKYVNSTTKLKWQCKDNHIWEARPGSIKIGQWCPICASNISEKVCRGYLELIFDEKFPKIRPGWLVNSLGKKMELDGFCENLKLAFEYQGKQHYEEISHFHRHAGSLQKRIIDDKDKERLCKENEVNLIIIPYTIHLRNIYEYIIDRCKQLGVDMPEHVKTDYKKLDIYSPGKLEAMNKIAETHGGKCISDNYVNISTKLKWKCSAGHVWEAWPSDIKNGSWCTRCAGLEKLTIEEMQRTAEKHNGKCLSDKYTNANTKLKWQCNRDGYIWEAAPRDIRSGHWCPKCAGMVKLTIDEMRNIAEGRGGKCLSDKYINAGTKLKWQCKEGHVWEAAPSDIKTGKWCRKCAGLDRLTIEEMRGIAENRGGKCLSDEYVNSHTKLKWQCKNLHIWEAAPSSVKFGAWCSQCAGKKKLTIEEMVRLAEDRGGKCLSDEYINAITKLKWQCKEGHIWETRPNDVKNGRWCPRCSRLKIK